VSEGTIFMHIVQTHDHVFKERHKRLSKKTKDAILAFTKLKVPNKVIAEEKFDPLDRTENEMDKMVILNDVWRIKRTKNPRFETENLKEAEGVIQVCKELVGVRAINLRDLIPNIDDFIDDTLEKKYVDTIDQESGRERFALVFISDEQRKLFAQYPWIILADGKHFFLFSCSDALCIA
jgi:hypothetical protein